MRKIAIVTGSRADYGYLRPLIRKVHEDRELNLLLYVTGMHLMKGLGDTLEDVRRDGFPIAAKVDMGHASKKKPRELAASIAQGIENFSGAFDKSGPDVVVVFGDRIESFAAAVAAASMNIPLAHISGGEVGLGDLDDSLRHAITKLANLHFTSSRNSRERVLKLGEEEWRVFQVGALSLDAILKSEATRIDRKLQMPDKKTILVSFHPTTTEWEEAGKQMKILMDAVLSVSGHDSNVVVIYPNDYPGGEEIINTLKGYDADTLFVFRSLPHDDYISLMKRSTVLVGNTSSGIIEAPSLGLPYVCVGTRQESRERAGNVIDTAYDYEKIRNAVLKAISDEKFLKIVRQRKTPYGDGNASGRIVNVLKKIDVGPRLLKKRMTY